MKILSGLAPWWWAIVHLGKNIDNRKWNPSYRGEFLLHSTRCSKQDYSYAIKWMINNKFIQSEKDFPSIEELAFGCIIGKSTIFDVIPRNPTTSYNYPKLVTPQWHMKEQYGLALKDTTETEHIIFENGQPGHFFDAPIWLLARFGL